MWSAQKQPSICLSYLAIYQWKETSRRDNSTQESFLCTLLSVFLLLFLLMLTNEQRRPVVDRRGAETPAGHPSALFPWDCLHCGRGHKLASSAVTRKPHFSDTGTLSDMLSPSLLPCRVQLSFFVSAVNALSFSLKQISHYPSPWIIQHHHPPPNIKISV